MFEFAHFITPYCCMSFKQFFSGVLIMMDNSCLLSIYHIHIVHSMHCESNSIKTIIEIKKSSCSFFFLIQPTDAVITQIYFVKKLRVLGSSSALHQEFSILHSAMVYVMQF